METKIRQDLKVFSLNSSVNNIHMEPMPKADRAFVHDIVLNEYDGLNAANVGEDEDRHVVIYRKARYLSIRVCIHIHMNYTNQHSEVVKDVVKYAIPVFVVVVSFFMQKTTK